MRVLVAGWHGQIAMALTEAAARRADVKRYAVGRPALDLTDRPTVGRTLFDIQPDVIINTAAYTDVEGAEREPHIATRRNKEGAAALARQAANIGVPIIHLSTVYVFDGVAPETAGCGYSEEDPTNPINAYGRSKLDGEAAVAAANDRHLILRTGWVYSPYGRNFVTNVLGQAKSKEVIEVDQQQIGSPTYAPHLASAILDIAALIVARSDDIAWGIYHIADSDAATWMDMARQVFSEIQRRSGKAPKLIGSDDGPGTGFAARPQYAVLDCSSLSDAFDVRMPDWKTAVKDCVERIVAERDLS